MKNIIYEELKNFPLNRLKKILEIKNIIACLVFNDIVTYIN